MLKAVATKLDELNLVDKFLFDETMENVEAYELLVSILMENQIHLLSKTETEKELRISPELRTIRLDVVSMDDTRQVYFTEMQKKNTYNLQKRSRYYQAHVDVSLLPSGEMNFNKLPNSCLILIAPFDIFGRGLYRYTFEGTCNECPDLQINDGAVRIFINTEGKNPEDFSDEFLDLMKYVTDSSDEVAEHSKSERLKRLHENVKKVKLSEKAGVKLMQTWEEQALIRNEGREEGREEGANLVCMLIQKLMSDGKNNLMDKVLRDVNFRNRLMKEYGIM